MKRKAHEVEEISEQMKGMEIFPAKAFRKKEIDRREK